MMSKNVRVNSKVQDDEPKFPTENSARHNQPNSQQKPHQNSHSTQIWFKIILGLGRDLQGMGLITQVRQGDTAPTVVNAHGQPVHNNISPLAQQHFGIDIGSDSSQKSYLLKPQKDEVKGKKTLVLDLDETLVHSSFKPPKNPDIVLPVDIEGRICHVYVVVRPGCLYFLQEMAKYYEIVIFTASLSKYADPLMDILDQAKVAPQRLFREHCTFYNGIFVKDMSRLGRSMNDIIIIDNSPSAYMLQPENGMPILSWYDDKNDKKLLDYIPALKQLAQVPDVRPILKECCTRDNIYQLEKSIQMCNKIIEDQKEKQAASAREKDIIAIQHLSRMQQTQDLDNQMIDQCRITTEDGPGLDEDIKRLQGISKTVNEKVNEKRISKLGEVRVSQERKESYKYLSQKDNAPTPIDIHNQKPKVNTWLNKEEDSSKDMDQYFNFKYSTTPQQKNRDVALSYQQIGAQLNNEAKQAQHTMYRTLYEQTQTPQSKRDSPNKKRPQTANKDPYLSKPLGQISSVRRSVQDKSESMEVSEPTQNRVSQKKYQSQQKKPIVINSHQIMQNNDLQLSSQTPQYQSQKLAQPLSSKQSSRAHSKGGSSSITVSTVATLNDHTKKQRPSTTQNSSRNSTERMRDKINMNGEITSSARGSIAGVSHHQHMRASSAKKNLENDFLQVSSQQTPQSKQITVTTFLSQYNNKLLLQDTPLSQAIQQQQQYYTQLKTTTNYQHQQLETPTKSNQHGILGKQITPQIMSSKQYSSSKKSKPSFQGKRTSESARHEESNSNSGMKTPGKIFKFDRNQDVVQSYNGSATIGGSVNGIREDGYSNLLKNSSLTQLKSNKTSTFNITENSASKRGSIKDVKITNNHNANLQVNKYSSALSQMTPGQNAQMERDSEQMSSKNGRINNMLTDYERTKNFNQELLKNIGSPKGPIFARTTGGQGQDL